MWWKLLAGAAMIALAAFLITRYGAARYDAGELAERVKWKDVSLEHAIKVAELRVANERRIVGAVETYAARLSEREPIILRSTETVTRYAQTPAGRVLCLAPDRVLGIEQDRAALFSGYPLAAETSAAAMLPDAGANR